MKPVHLGPVPADLAGKLDWCIRSIQALADASSMDDPNKIADEFTCTNVNHTRTLDVTISDLGNFAEVKAAIEDTRNVLATLLSDLHQRGSKRQA